jgi:hypothetical protein
MRFAKKFLKAVAMLFIAVIFVSQLYSQSGPRSVSIRLQQPPPNQLNISNLWRATLTNNTKAPIKIYLEGFAEEEKGGRIVEGKTEVFTLPLGKKDYKYEDFKTGTVKWINKKYEEPIIRTGTAPSGTYTICMTAKNEQGEVVGMEQCITHIVDIQTEPEITLISPNDGEKIQDPNPMFIWSPPMPTPQGKLIYELRLVEIIGNQSPEDAIKDNPIYYSINNILSNQLQYPMSAPNLRSDKKYAWIVAANDVKSSAFSFGIIKNDSNYTEDEVDDIYPILSKLETNKNNNDYTLLDDLIDKMSRDSLDRHELKQTLIEFYKLCSEDLEYVLHGIRMNKVIEFMEEKNDINKLLTLEKGVNRYIKELNKESFNLHREPFHLALLKGKDIDIDRILQKQNIDLDILNEIKSPKIDNNKFKIEFTKGRESFPRLVERCYTPIKIQMSTWCQSVTCSENNQIGWKIIYNNSIKDWYSYEPRIYNMVYSHFQGNRLRAQNNSFFVRNSIMLAFLLSPPEVVLFLKSRKN